MKIIGIIPARFASTRFPGKPLIDIGGKTMIRRVYEQAIQAKLLSEVIVATDDERIFNEIDRIGGSVMITSSNPKNGTERCAEAISTMPSVEVEVVINIQGDEPFIQPAQIDLLAGLFMNTDYPTQIGTLIRKFQHDEEKDNPSRVKAFVDENLQALMFSRKAASDKLSGEKYQLFKHIGIYGYRKDVLLEIARLTPSPLEISESLEQLRWMENGYTIKCAVTDQEAISIDTPEDLARINSKL